MKPILILLSVLFTLIVSGQEINVPDNGCKINTISTNPDNYQNSSDPSNSRVWDWRTETFTAYYKQSGMGDLGFPESIRSPFHELISNENILHFTDAVEKDYESEDGWELLYHNFGSPDKGIDNAFYMLYNRYSGTIRVFVNIKNSGNTVSNAATITLAFANGERRTAVFNQLGQYTKALENYDSRALAANNNKYVNSGVNDNFYWLSADFTTMYDPCTCGLTSDFILITTLISETKVDLSINGTITTLLDNTGSSQTISPKSPLTAIKQYFDFGNSLIEDVNGIFTSANQAHATGEQLQNAADQFVMDNSSLFGAQQASEIARQIELILFEVPAIGQWLKFGSTLISTIKKTGENFEALSVSEKKKHVVNSKVSTQNLKLQVSGNLIQPATFLSAQLRVPGSEDQGLPDFRNPIYDNVLGVFNLLENPKVTVTKYLPPEDLQVQYNNEVIANEGWDFFPNLYKAEITNPLIPLLNPASNLKIVSMEARMEYISREGPSQWLKGPMKLGKLTFFEDLSFIDGYQGDREQYYESIGCNFLLYDKDNYTNPNYKWDKSLFASDFVGQGCLKGTRVFNWTEMENIVVKVNVVLEPINNDPTSSVDKLLMVYTFPATVTNTTSPVKYVISGATNNVVLHENVGYNELGIEIPGVPTVSSIEYPDDVYLTNQTISQDFFAKGVITIGPNVQFSQDDIHIESLETIKIMNTPILSHSVGQNLTFRAKNEVLAFPEVILEPSIVLEIDDALLPPCAYDTPVFPKDEQIASFCNSSTYDGLSRPSKNLLDVSNSDIHRTAIDEIKIYPNPANESLIVEFKNDFEHDEIELLDMTGRVIDVNYTIDNSLIRIDLNNISSGHYQIKIKSNSKLFIKPFVKN